MEESKILKGEELRLSLHEKGEQLATLFNEINDIIRASGGYNINDIADFTDLAEWKWKPSGNSDKAESMVNPEGINQLSKKIEARAEMYKRREA